jgi:hypothetical protein
VFIHPLLPSPLSIPFLSKQSYGASEVMIQGMDQDEDGREGGREGGSRRGSTLAVASETMRLFPTTY